MGKKTGFLHYINISQRDMVEYNLDLDFNDMAIYALFKHIALSGVSKTRKIGDETYYQFTANFVIDQLPLLGIKTRQNINRRMQKLSNAGIIEPYEGNKKECVSLFKFGNMHYTIHDRLNENECNVKEQPVTQKLHTCNANVTPPVTEKLHYNNTIDNLNNNKVVEEKRKKTKVVKRSAPANEPAQDTTTTPDLDRSVMTVKSELMWQMDYTDKPELNAKLTEWAYNEILQQLPAVCAKHGKSYTVEQLQAWVRQQLTTDKVNVGKTQFTMYGEPMHSDTVKHLVNRCNWQLTNRGGLDLLQVGDKAKKVVNNYSSPF